MINVLYNIYKLICLTRLKILAMDLEGIFSVKEAKEGESWRPVYFVPIFKFTKDDLVELCQAARIDMDEYCLNTDVQSKDYGRYCVLGRFILLRLASFVESLANVDPTVPITKVHYVSPASKTTRDMPIYIEEDLMFYMQIHSEGVHSCLKQFMCQFAIGRLSDQKIVFSGHGNLFQKN